MRRSLGVSCIALLLGAIFGASAAAAPEPPTPRLPNLFAYPPSWLIGPITGHIETWETLSADPLVVDGCLPEERALGAERCLRFTTKAANFNLPDLEMALRAEPSGMSAYQVVRGPNDSVRYRPAGTFSVDPLRGEVQLDDFLVTRLWSLRDGRRAEIVAETPARGFCPAFFGPVGAYPHGKCAYSGVRMGPGGPEKILRLGWLQQVWIESHEPDQYIDISGVPDGRYALEIEIDPLDHVAESYELDNATCVEIGLRGDHVKTFRPGLCWPPRTRQP